MSGYRGGGRGRGRGGPRRDYGHPYPRYTDRGGPSSLPPRPVQENPSSSALKSIIKLADAETFDTQEDLPRLARYIAQNWPAAQPGVFEGFEIGVTENPHKLPYYAALLLLLSRDAQRPVPQSTSALESAAASADAPAKQADVDMVAVDSLIEGAVKEEDGAKAAQGASVETEKVHVLVLRHLGHRLDRWLSERDWLKVRLTMVFFAHLVSLKLISAQSFISALTVMSSKVKEIAEKGGSDVASVDTRADRLIRIVTESLLRSGPAFFEDNEDALKGIIDDVKACATPRTRRDLCKVVDSKVVKVVDDELVEIFEEVENNTYHCINVLDKLRERGFTSPAFLPVPSKRFPLPEGEEPPAPWDLPSVFVPELEDDVLGRVEHGEGQIGEIYTMNKKGVTDGRVPNPSEPDGWCMRSLLLDIVYIYEVNRIECASLLIRIPDFVLPDTFVEPPPRPAPGTSPPEPAPGEWTRPSTIINVIVSTMLNLPFSSHKLIYYVSLLTQLCILEKNEMAPPLGLAFKTLYSKLGNKHLELDVEIARRTAEWLALHLSNFAFSWLWKEWMPDLALFDAEPKKAFMKRVVDQEIRLAYHDRILSTLPADPFVAEDGKEYEFEDNIISTRPLEENYKFKADDVEHAAEARELLDMVRRREHADDVLDKLREMAGCASDEPIPPAFCEVATHVLLELGKGAFAHHLRVLERYLAVFKALASTPEARQQLLASSADFWKHNIQQQVIVFGKYHFYSILDASDIVTFVFTQLVPSAEAVKAGEATAWTTGHAWDLLKVALEQQFGFAVGSRRKYERFAAEDREARARKAAADGENAMAVDEESSQQVATAKRNAERLRGELESLLFLTMDHFVKSLAPFYYPEITNPYPSEASVMCAARAGLDYEDWREVHDTYARCGWFKHFLRVYAKPLKSISERVNEEILAPLPTRRDLNGYIGLNDGYRLASGYFIRELWAEATGSPVA